jgi:hypothetical protein
MKRVLALLVMGLIGFVLGFVESDWLIMPPAPIIRLSHMEVPRLIVMWNPNVVYAHASKREIAIKEQCRNWGDFREACEDGLRHSKWPMKGSK